MSSIPFQSSLTDPSLLTVSVATNAGCTSLTITDSSNYTTNNEPGHAEADFSQYRVLNINYMNVSSYLMSTITQTTPYTPIPAPSSGTQVLGLPLITGDGWYQITLNTVPTYNNSAAYVQFVNQVYYNGVIYTSILSSSGGFIPTNTTYWTPATVLYPKYSCIVYTALTCQQVSCLASLLQQAFCGDDNFACATMCNNTAFQDFLKMLAINYAINLAGQQNQLQFTTNYFNAAADICGCAQPSNSNYTVS